MAQPVTDDHASRPCLLPPSCAAVAPTPARPPSGVVHRTART